MSFLSADRDLTQQSYYAATAVRTQSFSPLEGAHECDVAIVGGGLAGLSAALELSLKGYSVRVLEGQQVGFGASGRNGGQAIHGLACDQETIEAELGMADAKRVWNMSIEALDLIRQRIRTHDIDCDWQDGYLGVATSPAKARSLAQGTERLQKLYGYDSLQSIAASDMPRWIDSPRYHGGVFDPRSGHLHPLKYTLGLARAAAQAGAVLHERSAVTRLESATAATERHTLHTKAGHLRARFVLLAGNVYLQDVVPALKTRIMPVGTYIACSQKLSPALANSLIPSRAAVCDTDFVLDYFRLTADDRMLYGGRVSYSASTPPNLKESMRQRMVATFPQLKDVGIDFTWGGFVDISMSRAPDFGRLAPNLYYLQGFSGHGLALTGLAGKLVAEAVHGDATRFDVFARIKHRDFPGGTALRTPALVLGMAWYRMRDALGF